MDNRDMKNAQSSDSTSNAADPTPSQATSDSDDESTDSGSDLASEGSYSDEPQIHVLTQQLSELRKEIRGILNYIDPDELSVTKGKPKERREFQAMFRELERMAKLMEWFVFGEHAVEVKDLTQRPLKRKPMTVAWKCARKV